MLVALDYMNRLATSELIGGTHAWNMDLFIISYAGRKNRYFEGQTLALSLGVTDVVGEMTYQWPEDVLHMLGQSIGDTTPVVNNGPKGGAMSVDLRKCIEFRGTAPVEISLLKVASS